MVLEWSLIFSNRSRAERHRRRACSVIKRYLSLAGQPQWLRGTRSPRRRERWLEQTNKTQNRAWGLKSGLRGRAGCRRYLLGAGFPTVSRVSLLTAISLTKCQEHPPEGTHPTGSLVSSDHMSLELRQTQKPIPYFVNKMRKKWYIKLPELSQLAARDVMCRVPCTGV